MARKRLRLAAIATTTACLSFLALAAGRAAAAEQPCNGRAMFIVAHEDDDLIFQSPTLPREIESGRCVRTVFLTAGDDGKGESYWHAREQGVEAAYAEMAGVADSWTVSTTSAHGHALRLETLTEEPRISVVFMRLPDGIFPEGLGSATYHHQSLMQLWNSGHPCGGCAEKNEITAVDGSNTFDYQGLVETLAALIDGYGPRQLATQDYLEEFFHGDHPDHVATGYFVREAQKSDPAPHRLSGYVGYNSEARTANVSGELLSAKDAAFYAYGAHDEATCDSEASCAGGEYETWLERQYVAGTETTGVVANAGFAQTTTAGGLVTLDGLRSSNESGDPLAYEWVQSRGPAVTLSSSTAAKPTFTAPSHPTLLAFTLTVEDGVISSPPDTVYVRVPSASSDPVAVAGPEQTVASGAAVQLDGSASWDPNSEPLGYEWEQTAGPPVGLSGSGAPQPTFTAPTGPATLTFSLVVSSSGGESAPSAVTVKVKGVAPSFTSAAATSFTTGGSRSFTVTTSGSPAATIGRGGELPAGVSFVDNGDGTATISGTPAADDAPAGGSRAYSLTIGAENEFGTASQAFTLTVVSAESAPPAPPLGPEPNAPSFTSADTAYGLVGRPLSIAVVANGAPAPALSLAGPLPDGLRFEAGAEDRGTLSGTPTTAGTSRIDLVAASAAGSARQTLTLIVDPQPKLSRSLVRLPLGRRSRQLVRVLAASPTSMRCAGHLPRGARCVVGGQRKLFVEGSPRVGRPGTYRLTVVISCHGGTVRRPLAVRVRPLRG